MWRRKDRRWLQFAAMRPSKIGFSVSFWNSVVLIQLLFKFVWQTLFRCEARFVRFRLNGKQFSRKICRCLSVSENLFCCFNNRLQEPICTPMELGQIGCTTYKSMSRQTQRSIRKWTMSEAEKNAPINQYGNEYKNASVAGTFYSDQERHSQLLNGTTKFCCRIDKSATHRRYSFRSKRPLHQNSATLVRSLNPAGFLLLLLAIY
jgi:hypothetical protein